MAGPVSRPGYAPPFPRHEATEETVREIDQDVRALLGQARGRARGILVSRRAVLNTIARLLLPLARERGSAVVIERPFRGGAVDCQAIEAIVFL